jgi:hypothetical protein
MDTGADQTTQTTWDDIPADILAASTDEILTRIRLIENDLKVWSALFLDTAPDPFLGNAFRNAAITTRAIRHERKDSG